MKRKLLVCCALACSLGAQAQWKPAGDKIKTQWADALSPESVWPEYPRPRMERTDWLNLNGTWEYAILPAGQGEPKDFEGSILVPFAAESSLSGVQKEVGVENELWYRRTFTVPSKWKGKNLLLNFGAVDWKAEVFVNDILVGSHKGGYAPFSFDITPCLRSSGPQKLVVRVWDPGDKGFQPRGKQTSSPEGIWYTPVTGIWQTVWLEPVAPEHITAVNAFTDPQADALRVTVAAEGCPSSVVEAVLLDGGKAVASAKGLQGQELRLAVANPSFWSPDDPHLYDLQVTLLRDGKPVDSVKSYAAFRRISTGTDASGIRRFFLNGKPLFMYGPLDQGWWPDGLYTAPSDEALLFDIRKTKDWGFNMIRKHVKAEPDRWYYHCDRLGILVWQDMPSGDLGNSWEPRIYNGGSDRRRSPESADNFLREWKEIMDLCMMHPSVVVWVPFNEGWGQFDTERVVAWTERYDPSRPVNPASGGNHRPCGSILDLHNYPGPAMFLSDPARVNVLGEYGGIGLPVEGHLWWDKRNWGYVQFKDGNAVTDEYVRYAGQLKELVKRGFSAAVYTQTTDVEGEVNGLMTYDRRVVKIDEGRVREANRAVIQSLGE